MQEAWRAKGEEIALVSYLPFDSPKTLGRREQVRRAALTLFGLDSPQENRPTALVCGDENVAAVTVQTLAEVGRRVPQHVSLAAFGDTPRLAEALSPALTVIRQPAATLAKAAIAALYQRHETKSFEAASKSDISLPVQLIIRASCTSPERL